MRAKALKTTRSGQGAMRSSSTWRRSSISIFGMSMRTGQASAQAPQSDEACARSFTDAGPLSIAVRRMPIGPGYV